MMTQKKIRDALDVGVLFCFFSIVGFCALLMFEAALAALAVGATLSIADYLLPNREG